MKRIAIVTGVTGQDGSYLADLLLEKDYKVYGFKRRTSGNELGCCAHLENEPDFEIVEGDVTDQPSLQALTRVAQADEFYNLASQSHVGTSFKQPAYTAQASGIAVLNCLEAIRESGFHTRFYQASTSELYGGQRGEFFCTEETPFHPRSPYGCAKMYGYSITVNYREAYKMFTCNGILFNHESPRRGPNFVTRKITQGVAAIKAGKQKKLYLGNLKSKRDWGHAKDYVRGMWMMLNHNEPGDYVLATGETHSVEEFCRIAFSVAGLGDFQQYVEVDPRFYRPAEVDILLGDATKAKEILGWEPQHRFEDLVKDMVQADIELLK
jgi:GDPmannose 4,6-dehydratase